MDEDQLSKSFDKEFVDKQRACFDQLYESYPVTIAKAISRKERETTSNMIPRLVYGEIDFDTFALCLEKVKTKYGNAAGVMQEPGGVFYDIGSGTGKPVIAASLLYPFQRACGIEFLNGLYSISVEIAQTYQQQMQEFDESCCQVVEFVRGDATDDTCDWSDADLVYMNSTCFDDDLMEKLAKRAEKLAPGRIVITTTKDLPSSEFTIVETETHQMSWGSATIVIQRRN